MTIASEITRLQGAKADIKTAIENKGVTVSSADTIDQYAGYIDQIQQGSDQLKLKAIGANITRVGVDGSHYPTSVGVAELEDGKAAIFYANANEYVQSQVVTPSADGTSLSYGAADNSLIRVTAGSPIYAVAISQTTGVVVTRTGTYSWYIIPYSVAGDVLTFGTALSMSVSINYTPFVRKVDGSRVVWASSNNNSGRDGLYCAVISFSNNTLTVDNYTSETYSNTSTHPTSIALFDSTHLLVEYGDSRTYRLIDITNTPTLLDTATPTSDDFSAWGTLLSIEAGQIVEARYGSSGTTMQGYVGKRFWSYSGNQLSYIDAQPKYDFDTAKALSKGSNPGLSVINGLPAISFNFQGVSCLVYQSGEFKLISNSSILAEVYEYYTMLPTQLANNIVGFEDVQYPSGGSNPLVKTLKAILLGDSSQ